MLSLRILNMLKKYFLKMFIGTILFISGCNHPHYNQTESNIADTTQRVVDAREKSNISGKPIPTLIVNEGMYVDPTPINIIKQPAWLKNEIIIRGDQLPFSYYSTAIATGGGKNILTHYQAGLNQASPVSVNYSGSVKGALDLLATKTGYVYKINGNQIYWQEFITKTFDIAFMPGTSDYQMGKSSGGSGSALSSTNAASSSTTTAGIIDDNTSQEYSNLKGNLSVWNDLKTSIQAMLSPGGKVMLSESTSTVTVRDKQTNVSLIDNYIQNLNKNLSKQVLIKIEVVDISLNSAFNYGIDWTLVGKTLKTQQLFLHAHYGTPVVTITPLIGTPPFDKEGAPGLPQLGTKKLEKTGVTAIINALTQQGKVSIVTQPRVVCLNNQVSVIRMTEQQGYLASVQTTAQTNSSGTSAPTPVVSQVTPGNVVTGFTLYILPKILGDKVYLQINADLSLLTKLKPLSTQGTGDPDHSPSTAPFIQVPELSQKQFNQRAVIGNNDTLILSGFRQLTNQTGSMQLLNSQELGGKASQQINTETIILITPIVLSSSE